MAVWYACIHCHWLWHIASLCLNMLYPYDAWVAESGAAWYRRCRAWETLWCYLTFVSICRRTVKPTWRQRDKSDCSCCFLVSWRSCRSRRESADTSTRPGVAFWWFCYGHCVRLSFYLSVTLVDCDHILQQKVEIGTCQDKLVACWS